MKTGDSVIVMDVDMSHRSFKMSAVIVHVHEELAWIETEEGVNKVVYLNQLEKL